MNPLLTEIRNDISGLAALHDWLGDGGDPVHPMVAEFRTQRCTEGNDGEPCPLNKAPRWWESAKGKIADWIRRELEIKSGMSLRVAGEENLHMCSACGCCLPLKVWTPKVHLKTHIDQKAIDKTPAYCWMRKELS